MASDSLFSSTEQGMIIMTQLFIVSPSVLECWPRVHAGWYNAPILPSRIHQGISSTLNALLASEKEDKLWSRQMEQMAFPTVAT